MDKKGAAPRYITILIMAFLALVLLGAVLIFFIGPSILLGGDRATCEQWVDLNTKKIEGVKLVSSIPGHADSPCYATIDKIDPKDENQVYSTVAEEMYSCFTQYGGPDEKDFYSDWSGWDKQDIYCRVCADLEFKDDFEFDGTEFGKYLATHEIPELIGRQKNPKTYLEFLTGIEKSRDIDFEKDMGTISLKDGSRLYVTYAITKERGFSFERATRIVVTSTVQGAAYGAIFGWIPLVGEVTIGGGSVLGLGFGVLAASADYAFSKDPGSFGVLVGEKEDMEAQCGEGIYYKTRPGVFANLNPLKGDDNV